MRIAHLILVHKAPGQLERLVRALAHPEATCFIHLDRKADKRAFDAVALLPNAQFIQHRLDVKWGGYSLTRAALEGMRAILQAADQYDFINLISGEDYPIKPLAEIHDFFRQHLGQSFLEYYPSDSAWWQANQIRITQYHFTELRFPGQYAIQRLLNRLLPPRKLPLLPALYGGDMGGWYTLSRMCAAYVVEFIDAHSQLRRFARLTWGSDEFLVHTVLLNSPLATTITNDNLRYIDWSGGGSSPKCLTSADLPALAASPKLFARKFDESRDVVILDQLDQLNR